MLIGKNILYFTELTSTNDHAKKMVLGGTAKNGDAVIANNQTAGKGRMGRSWIAEPDAGLYTSVIIELPTTAIWATLLFGLAALNAVEKTIESGSASLKWPNDVLISGKKVCGILVEGCRSPDGINYFIVGVGINVNNNEFPAELSNKATSLFLETGENYSVSKIATQLFHEMDYLYERCKKDTGYEGFRPFAEEYRQKCMTLNKDVIITVSRNVISCRAVDIAATGGLVIKLDNDATMIVSSGEVSVRGALGYV
ncbi:MAG: biotin--[acetyl-CoA-carboxylase] ligase [Defluviitaleaceae bacterium]|nr:biotin--[acetyl-CoA-carboxylase] ligase [Defluviitaleaceae bacterium]